MVAFPQFHDRPCLALFDLMNEAENMPPTSLHPPKLSLVTKLPMVKDNLQFLSFFQKTSTVPKEF